MPEYLLSVNHVEGDPTPSGEEMERMFADVGAFNDKVRESGSWVFAGGLMPRETATTVDNTGEEARSAHDAAIELAENAAEQAWLVRRRDSLA